VKAPLLLLAPLAALVACGSSSTGSGGTATPSPAATESATAAPTATAVPTATPAPSTPAPTAAPAGVVVGTGSTANAGTVLVDAQGHTLYHFTPEAHGGISCTGSCASTWPPLMVPAGQQVQAHGSLSGSFATVKRPDGSMQATYNGWPLYRYSGDSSAGTANGQGLFGKWFAVTPNQAAAGM
jgi:predicted lipoprotein with Yx(FWY)xxD motif